MPRLVENLLVIKCNKLYRELLQQHLQKNAKLIDKYDYLTGKEIKPFDHILVCEKTKKKYTPLSKVFTSQTKAHLEQYKKPLEAIEKINLLQQI